MTGTDASFEQIVAAFYLERSLALSRYRVRACLFCANIRNSDDFFRQAPEPMHLPTRSTRRVANREDARAAAHRKIVLYEDTAGFVSGLSEPLRGR
jgi:hypothetical protein